MSKLWIIFGQSPEWRLRHVACHVTDIPTSVTVFMVVIPTWVAHNIPKSILNHIHFKCFLTREDSYLETLSKHRPMTNKI